MYKNICNKISKLRTERKITLLYYVVRNEFCSDARTISFDQCQRMYGDKQCTIHSRTHLSVRATTENFQIRKCVP